MSDDAAVLLVDTGKEAGHVDKGDQWDVERITGPNEPGGLLRRLNVEHAGQHHRLVAHHADGTAVEASKAAHDALAPRGVVLHEVAVVDDVADHGLHVVGDVGAVRQDRVEFGTQTIGVVARFELWRDLEVVGRQEGQQVLDLIEDFFLAVGDIGGHARLRAVRAGTTEFLKGDFLARHRLHDVGAGDEHVRLLSHHEDEVGHRRAVDGAAGARAEDHRDLRNDARRLHISIEDAAVAVEADHAFLDPGAGAVVEPDHGRAGCEGEVHHLVELLGEHLAEGTAHDGEILGEDENLASVDRAPTGDHAVGVGPLVETGLMGPVAGEHVEFVERTRVEQILDPLTGEHLALVVLALDGALGAGTERGLLAGSQIVDLGLHGGINHVATLVRRPGGDDLEDGIGVRQCGPRVDRPGRRLTGVVGDRFARGGGQCDVEAIEVATLRDDGLDEPAVAVGVHVEREDPLVTARPSERLAGVAASRKPEGWAVALWRTRSEEHVVNDNVLAAMLHRLPGEKRGEHRDALVEHLASDARIDDFVELRQLAAGIDAEPEPQSETALRHDVDGHDLASEFDQPTPRDRGDHRSDPQPLGRSSERAEHHPRVENLRCLSAQGVIPQEESVPSVRLGSPGDVEKPLGVGEPTDRGEEHGMAHAAQ